MGPSRPLSVLRRAFPAAILLLLATAGTAFAGILAPEGGAGSRNAEDTRTLYWLIFALGMVVFVGVEGILLWCLFKFRAKKGRVAAQIHGNTNLEIGWTVGAALLLVFLTAVTFIMLPGIKNPAPSSIDAQGNPIAASSAAFAATDQPPPPDGGAMNIKVDGQQYVWRYKYPGQQDVFSYVNMYVPVGRTVTLDISADDVAHSWWIPELGGKQDALPGYINKTWFKITRAGIYRGQCAELCGRNHANMFATVIALPFDRWQEWYDEQAENIQSAKDQAAEERRRLEEAEGEAAAEGGCAAGGASGSTDTNP